MFIVKLGGSDYHSHFTEQDTDVQRDELTRSHSWEVAKSESEPRFLGLQSLFSLLHSGLPPAPTVPATASPTLPPGTTSPPYDSHLLLPLKTGTQHPQTSRSQVTWSRAYGVPLFLVNSASTKQMAGHGITDLTKWAINYPQEEERGNGYQLYSSFFFGGGGELLP